MYVLFDLDDTLVQTTFYLTEPRLKKAIDRVTSLGYKGKNFLELTKLNAKSNSAKEALQAFFRPLKKNQMYFQEAQDIVYNEILAEEIIEPFSGVIYVLNQLKKKHTLALVTYGSESIQYKKLEKAGIESSIFSNIIVAKSKDKESSYREIFNGLDLDPKKVFVVGDRFKRDLQPAKELGFQTILVSWGRSQKADHHKVDFVIETMHELLKIIQ